MRVTGTWISCRNLQISWLTRLLFSLIISLSLSLSHHSFNDTANIENTYSLGWPSYFNFFSLLWFLEKPTGFISIIFFGSSQLFCYILDTMTKQIRIWLECCILFFVVVCWCCPTPDSQKRLEEQVGFWWSVLPVTCYDSVIALYFPNVWCPRNSSIQLAKGKRQKANASRKPTDVIRLCYEVKTTKTLLLS